MTTQRKAITLLVLTCLLSPLSAMTYAVENETTGILVIAHGSPKESWCKPIRELVENVTLSCPIELGFLEFVEELEGYCFIPEAVEKLDAIGVTKIIAVPLFISSSSGHIAEIEYVLGLRDMWPGEEDPLLQVDTEAEIVLTGAVDDHWTIAQILVDRVTELCKNPGNETVIIIAHGTPNETYFDGWINSLESLAEQVKLMLRHSKGLDIETVRYSFIHVDETLYPDLMVRAVVENVSATSDPIVVPLMISGGFFTETYIPGLLENLTYAYDGKALTPHSNVGKWIEITASREFSDLTIQIYDGTELLNISIEDVGEHHGHICPCVAIAFRVAELAFSEEIWGGIPHRGDVKIICGHPSDGHEETFESILNSPDDLMMKKGDVNLTKDNYVYTFMKKSTGDSITVEVNETIFPEGFFDLRKKCKAKTATPEEMKTFKLAKEELKESFMFLPIDAVFSPEAHAVEEIAQEIEEPEEVNVVGGAIFFSMLVIGLILLLALIYGRRKAR